MSRDRPRAWVWWVALIAVFAVVVAAAVIAGHALLRPTQRSQGHTPIIPSPSPALPSSAATPSPSVAALPGAGDAIAYVQTTAAVYRITLATGRITRTIAPFDDQDASLLAGRDWVLCEVHNAAGDGVLIRDNKLIHPFPDGLPADDGFAEPGPGSTVWHLPSQTSDNVGPETITLHRLDGSTIADTTIHLPASTESLRTDQNGYLLENSAGRIYLHTPDTVTQIATGNLVATGPHHLLTWTCDTRARCTLNLIDRSNGHSSVIPDQNALKALNYDVASTDEGNLISPDGRHAVLDGCGSTFSRTVIDLSGGQAHKLPGSPTQYNPSSQTGWTGNSRWLLTLTDRQLRAYDAKTGQTRTLPVTTEPLIHLAVS